MQIHPVKRDPSALYYNPLVRLARLPGLTGMRRGKPSYIVWCCGVSYTPPVMLRRPILSSAILCLFLSLPCVAQDLVPFIRLSADEAAKAKQLAQTLKDATERSTKAKVAWEQFHQSYQSAHPDLRR